MSYRPVWNAGISYAFEFLTRFATSSKSQFCHAKGFCLLVCFIFTSENQFIGAAWVSNCLLKPCQIEVRKYRISFVKTCITFVYVPKTLIWSAAELRDPWRQIHHLPTTASRGILTSMELWEHTRTAGCPTAWAEKRLRQPGNNKAAGGSLWAGEQRKLWLELE